MRTLQLVILLVFSAPIAAAPLGIGSEDVGRERLAKAQSADLPGVAYAVTDDGEMAELGVAGVKKRGKKDPIAADTTFLIGSISKSFTALAVMQMVESGKVSLDAGVATYLPSLKGSAVGNIPIRRLLNHTSGFSTAQGNTTQTDFAEDSAALGRRVSTLAQLTPASKPGERFEYSNANYQLLGRVIEAVSGMSYGDYVQSNILDPAGMQDSFVHPGPRSAQMASGHRYWFGAFWPDEKNLTGAGSAPQGGIASSARDMARYLGLLMNGEDDILSAAGKSQLMRSDDPAAPNYGFGWNIAADGRVWHAGSNPGYDALATMLPEERKGTVILVNALGGAAFGRTIPLELQLTEQTLGIKGIKPPSPALPRIVMLVIVIAAIAFAWGLFRIWNNRHRVYSRRGWFAALAIGLPLILTFLFAFATLVMVPASFGGNLSGAWLYAPDLTILLVIAAVLALAWGISRTYFLLTSRAMKA